MEPGIVIRCIVETLDWVGPVSLHVEMAWNAIDRRTL